MAVPSKVFLTTPSDTSTEASGAVGEMREYTDATHGKQMFRLVKNTTGSDIATAICVAFKSSIECVLPAATEFAVKFAGVSIGSIPIGSYGWVCCAGQVTATANSAIAAGAHVITEGVTGKMADPGVAGKEHAVLGVAITLAAALDDPFTMRLAGLI